MTSVNTPRYGRFEPGETAPKTILAIGAHPDDVEFLCAGTLALLHKGGNRIHIATVAAGDCGSAVLSASEISEIRLVEGTAAAQVLDAEYTCLGEKDIEIEHSNKVRRKVTELIRKVSPDIVFTLSPSDYMTDHEMTSRNVRDACFAAPIPNYVTGASNPAEPIPSVPTLYYTDAVESIDIFGDRIVPHFYVDISEAMETKKKMLASHASQREWLRLQHKVDHYIIEMENWSAARGKEIGVQYAECFRQHLGHGYPHANILTKMVPVTDRRQEPQA